MPKRQDVHRIPAVEYVMRNNPIVMSNVKEINDMIVDSKSDRSLLPASHFDERRLSI